MIDMAMRGIAAVALGAILGMTAGAAIRVPAADAAEIASPAALAAAVNDLRDRIAVEECAGDAVTPEARALAQAKDELLGIILGLNQVGHTEGWSRPCGTKD